jgi:hypothetical protein
MLSASCSDGGASTKFPIKVIQPVRSGALLCFSQKCTFKFSPDWSIYDLFILKFLVEWANKLKVEWKLNSLSSFSKVRIFLLSTN